MTATRAPDQEMRAENPGVRKQAKAFESFRNVKAKMTDEE